MNSIKLIKNAQWGGDDYKSGSVHSVGESPSLTIEVVNKLINRGYAKPHKKDVENASGKRSGSSDLPVAE